MPKILPHTATGHKPYRAGANLVSNLELFLNAPSPVVRCSVEIDHTIVRRQQRRRRSFSVTSVTVVLTARTNHPLLRFLSGRQAVKPRRYNCIIGHGQRATEGQAKIAMYHKTSALLHTVSNVRRKKCKFVVLCVCVCRWEGCCFLFFCFCCPVGACACRAHCKDLFVSEIKLSSARDREYLHSISY